MKKQYKVFNIKWDIDYCDDDDGNAVALPTEMTIMLSVDADESEDEIADRICDKISDTTEFCHEGFDFEEIK